MKNLQRATALVALLSLVALALLRLYTAAFTVVVVTWDDRDFRNVAMDAANHTTTVQAAREIFLPDEHANDALGRLGRTVGYHLWLVLGRTAFPLHDPERTWQLVNVVLFVLQGLGTYFGARAVKLPRDLSGVLTFLVLSSPMGFGLTRWVLTENHLSAALAVTSAVSLALVFRGVPRASSTPAKLALRDVLLSLAGGYVFGVFANLREYALPGYLLTVLGTLAALALEGRVLAAAAFLAGFAPFAGNLASATRRVSDIVAMKVGQSQYFHSITEFVPHECWYYFGPALTFVGLVGAVAAVTCACGYDLASARRRLGTPTSNPLSPAAAAMWLATVATAGGYWLALVASSNRLARNGAVTMPPLIILVLLGWQHFAPRIEPWLPRVRVVAIVLVAVSWATLVQQTVLTPGATWRHHCTNLEHYNHPLNLPDLHGDMHTTCPW